MCNTCHITLNHETWENIYCLFSAALSQFFTFLFSIGYQLFRLQSVSCWSLCHLPLQLIIRWRVLGGDVGQVSEDLGAVDGEAGQQDELLPGGAEEAGVVLYGKLAKEGQLLDPGDLTEKQLVCQAA